LVEDNEPGVHCAVAGCSKATDVVALDSVSLTALCDKFETLQAAFDTCQQLRSELDTNEHMRQLWRGFVHLSDEELEDQVLRSGRQ
jgi:uncharacterized protein (DUF2461 family)